MECFEKIAVKFQQGLTLNLMMFDVTMFPCLKFAAWCHAFGWKRQKEAKVTGCCSLTSNTLKIQDLHFPKSFEAVVLGFDLFAGLSTLPPTAV